MDKQIVFKYNDRRKFVDNTSKELEVTESTVRNALTFATESPIARVIRKMAIEAGGIVLDFESKQVVTL